MNCALHKTSIRTCGPARYVHLTRVTESQLAKRFRELIRHVAGTQQHRVHNVRYRCEHGAARRLLTHTRSQQATAHSTRGESSHRSHMNTRSAHPCKCACPRFCSNMRASPCLRACCSAARLGTRTRRARRRGPKRWIASCAAQHAAEGSVLNKQIHIIFCRRRRLRTILALVCKKFSQQSAPPSRSGEQVTSNSADGLCFRAVCLAVAAPVRSSYSDAHITAITP